MEEWGQDEGWAGHGNDVDERVRQHLVSSDAHVGIVLSWNRSLSESNNPDAVISREWHDTTCARSIRVGSRHVCLANARFDKH